MNLDRLNNHITQMGSIGTTPDGGVTRLAFTDEDMQGRKLLTSYMHNLGLEVYEDGIGNISGVWRGLNPTLPRLIVGSHIDTVPEGGKFDGVLGVLGALECIQTMREHGFMPNRSIEVVSFSAEESSRFNISTIGSKMISRPFDLQVLHQYKDKDDVSLYEILFTKGFDPSNLKQWDHQEIFAFLELHIEQGPRLELLQADIGIVDKIAAPTRLVVTIKGEAAHSGSCPMEYRKDALVAAAMVIEQVEQVGIEESVYQTVATIGRIDIEPGSMNVVPERAKLYLDIRGVDMQSIERALSAIVYKISNITTSRGLTFTVETISHETPVQLDFRLAGIIENICLDRDFKAIRMSSGAGHDSMNLARIVPTALILIPCVGGISHNKRENVLPKDINNGLNILHECMHRLSF
ncbi:MAG: Zn-dependent hydrolase [Spirochaetae bacterium HGW-Spirochaetae-2]|jgi:N-carbamoyl-L-amino-acid hydrolase|nr:MAG: Zn-dependent hydrolase [Spirochaetae bacterium HGW-Spirochaetae-2]